jgi:hypothetical protein
MEIDGGSAETRLRISTSGTDADEAGIILANSGKVGFNDGIQIAHGGGVTTFKDLAGEVQMAIDVTNSRVGIGTSSPASKFHVQSGALQVSGNSIDTVISYSNVGIVGTATNHDLAFISNNSEKMRIDASGNVGIGGTPTHKLYVRNDVFATTDLDPTSIKLYNNGDGGAAIEFSNGVVGNSKISFGVEGTGGGTDDSYIGFSTSANAATATERMRITSGGQVLIGTTSSVTSVNIGSVVKLQGLVKYYAGINFPSPYSQNIQIDITWNAWGGNNVIAVANLIVTSRQFGATGGIAFGTLFATNSGAAATLGTINTTDITTSQCTLTASSPSNYTLRLVIDPSNITDVGTVSLELPASTATEIASINVTLV